VRLERYVVCLLRYCADLFVTLRWCVTFVGLCFVVVPVTYVTLVYVCCCLITFVTVADCPLFRCRCRCVTLDFILFCVPPLFVVVVRCCYVTLLIAVVRCCCCCCCCCCCYVVLRLRCCSCLRWFCCYVCYVTFTADVYVCLRSFVCCRWLVTLLLLLLSLRCSVPDSLWLPFVGALIPVLLFDLIWLRFRCRCLRYRC